MKTTYTTFTNLLVFAAAAVLLSVSCDRPTTYRFSPDGVTLAIPADLDLDTVNIRELKAPSIAEKVTTLVVKGAHIDDDRLFDLREKGGWERLLPNLHSLSLPDFNETIPFECFLETEWLQHFSSPRATAAERGAFSNCYLLTTANLPEVTFIGPEAFRGCEDLIAAYFPIATTIGESAF
ncbi:MAG: leucine-rich repeat domain-containing protein, partial [Odoribacteraceae bacterium]|nr:leucine-rich repeat domain-containing protein [Odoribacteraceae bacterium]